LILAKHYCSVVVNFSFYGGSEDLSDDITQQQLLPGVKYEKKKINLLLIRCAELNLYTYETTELVLRDCSLAGILTCGPLSVRLVLDISNMWFTGDEASICAPFNFFVSL